MLLPNRADLLNDPWRCHVRGQLTDNRLTALRQSILAEQVHHTELEGIALGLRQVEGNLEHVIDCCRHNHRILLAHHHTIEFAEISRIDLTPQVILVDRLHKGVTVEIITRGDKSEGQLIDILIIEGELPVTLTIIVWDKDGRLLSELEGHDGLLHIDVDGLAGAQGINDLYLELLSPAESTSVRIGLRDDKVAVFIRGMNDRHTLLFHPDIAKLAHASSRILVVEDGQQIIPRGILKEVMSEVRTQTILERRGAHRAFEHTHHNWCLVVDDIIVEHAGIAQVVEIHRNGMGSLCAIDGNSTRLIGLHEVQVVIDLRILATSNLRGHEVGKHLLSPDILKPLQ